jgi:hypothetical protein
MLDFKNNIETKNNGMRENRNPVGKKSETNI